MAVKYADRAFLSINGAKLADIQSATLKQNHNRKIVPSMTNDAFNRGFTEGNRDIDISLTLAVRQFEASPKLEAIDYARNDIQCTFVCGSEQYVATGLFLKDDDFNAGGVGDEVKRTYNFGAVKVTDAVGNSALFSLQL
jgi:hypothetical protein